MNWNTPHAAFHCTVLSDPDFFTREQGLLPLSFSTQLEGGYHSRSSDKENNAELKLLSKFIAAMLKRIVTGKSNIIMSDPFKKLYPLIPELNLICNHQISLQIQVLSGKNSLLESKYKG